MSAGSSQTLPVEMSVAAPAPAVVAPRRRRWGPNAGGWLFLVVLLVAAEAVVRVAGLSDVVAEPSATVAALAEGLASSDLLGPLGTTLSGYAAGLLIATAAGVLIGVAIGTSRLVDSALSMVIEFLRPIPSVALIPLAIMYLGLGNPTRIFVVAYVALWPILLSTYYGIRGIDPLVFEAARICGCRGVRKLAGVTLPAALPSVITGVRVSISIGLLAAVTADFVTGTSGIGAYIQQQQLAVALPEMYAAILLTGLVGYALNLVFRVVERRVVAWSPEQRVERL